MSSTKPVSRVDGSNYEIKRRQPRKPTATTPKNHFYVTKKTNIAAQVKKIEALLANKEDEVVIHGLGSSLNRALVLALEVQKTFRGVVQFHISTSTVNVTDDLFPLSDEFEIGMRNRPISAVHISLYYIKE